MQPVGIADHDHQPVAAAASPLIFSSVPRSLESAKRARIFFSRFSSRLARALLAGSVALPLVRPLVPFRLA